MGNEFENVVGVGEFAKYPHIWAPPGFINVDRNGLFSTPAAGTFTLETIQITSGYHGWIRAIGLEASNFSKVFYTISVGGAPLRDYTRVRVPLGSPTTPKETFIELVPNLPLVLTATATDLGLALRWCLWGWYYAEK